MSHPPIKYVVEGFLEDGHYVTLGTKYLTDDESAEFLSEISKSYNSPDGLGWFQVGASIFRTNAFIGVRVRLWENVA